MATNNDGDGITLMDISSEYLEKPVRSRTIGENGYAVLHDEDNNKHVLVEKVENLAFDAKTENCYDVYESIHNVDDVFDEGRNKFVYRVSKGSVYGKEEQYFIEANRKALYISDEGMINCDAKLQLYVETEKGFVKLKEFDVDDEKSNGEGGG